MPARRTCLALVLSLAFAGAASAAQPPVFADPATHVAIHGTDPVAYFTEQKPVPGKPEFQTEWNGAVWQFATADNLAKFKADPAAYAPQYGGYCAWAVSQGYTATTEPEAWRIVDGKLYLNYNLDIRKKWEGDIPGYIAKANTNWPSVLEK
ncbi:MAG: YHS domain-containing (seleno)protein [Geminicoccaceae bacterium]